ncbi:MAG TPA: Zn-ribbon domain-containing OB-fold protein [Thermoplasmata archaeon]|nr:Zn-ribbon domain-containing OB-fold protein [Thermoplasmata archaeon]
MDLPLPFALDFYPLETPEFTRIHPFFDNLRKGKLTTTKCPKCGTVHWQPRVVCPKCNTDALEWIDLPSEGELFAFTAVMAGAPIGFEKDVPFVTGLVKLAGTEILLTARIDGARYEDLKIGDKVRLKVLELPDDRVWFRFMPVG